VAEDSGGASSDNARGNIELCPSRRMLGAHVRRGATANGRSQMHRAKDPLGRSGCSGRPHGWSRLRACPV
jgi:hypothetical protein